MSDLRAGPLKCARRPESSGSTHFCSSAEKVRMFEILQGRIVTWRWPLGGGYVARALGEAVLWASYVSASVTLEHSKQT